MLYILITFYIGEKYDIYIYLFFSVLPHSTVASTKEICLITPDLKKGRKVDHEPTIDHWEQLIREAGVTSVGILILYEFIIADFC